MSRFTCWNENTKTFFLTKKNRSCNDQNRVLSVLEAIWALKSRLNRYRQRFWALSDVLSTKLNDLKDRHLLNKNFLPFQDGNHVFGAQTIEMSEITWWNQNLKTFFQTKKKTRSNSHQNRVLSVLQVIWAVKSCPNR